jgi:hypothetical protein
MRPLQAKMAVDVDGEPRLPTGMHKGSAEKL